MENVFIDIRKAGGIISDYFRGNDIVNLDSLLNEFENLICELDRIKEEYDDFKRDVEDNMERIPVERQVGA